MTRIKHALAILISVLLVDGAMATCPLLDLVEYKGKTYPLAIETNPPPSQRLSEWRFSLLSCSAPGQGRPVYRIEGDQVFLLKFRGCGAELSVAEAYERSEKQRLATWLNGTLDVALGKCTGGWDPAKESFVVEQGRFVRFVERP